MSENEEDRIPRILGTKKVPQVSEEYLLKYRSYLLRELNKNVTLVGMEECFPWEEPYVIGDGSKRKYEKLKRKYPSCTDEFELLDILKDPVEYNDLIAKVKRLSDLKEFEIGLSWLAAKDKTSEGHVLLEDFAIWVGNWS